jgi:hypothetical protein
MNAPLDTLKTAVELPMKGRFSACLRPIFQHSFQSSLLPETAIAAASEI